jgi:hypothetical protein
VARPFPLTLGVRQKSEDQARRASQ